MVKWYCKVKGTVLGPFSEQELTLMVEKGKIRPSHPVKVETAMEWSKARDIPLIARLFSDDELAEDEERQAKKKKREHAESTTSYYAALGRDLRYGGEWLAILLKTIGICAILFGLAALIAGRSAGMMIPMLIYSLLVSTVGLVILLMFEAAVLGLPMLLFPKDWSHIEVMEVYAASYFYMLIAYVFIVVVAVTNPGAAAGMAYLLPLFLGGVFAYLVCTRWNIKLWIALILAVVRAVIWTLMVFAVTASLLLMLRGLR